MKLTENFDLNEGFLSPDAKCIPVDVMNNLLRLARNLQRLRTYIELPIAINSGWRTPEHNKKVGGVENSQHLLGRAADIWVKGMEPEELKQSIVWLIDHGWMDEGGIGIYDNFIHYDIRGAKVRWDYRGK